MRGRRVVCAAIGGGEEGGRGRVGGEGGLHLSSKSFRASMTSTARLSSCTSLSFSAPEKQHFKTERLFQNGKVGWDEGAEGGR